MVDNPHDRLFKHAFAQVDNARDYLRGVLPAELVPALDLERLECAPTDLVSQKLRELFSDLVYKIPFADDDAYVCTLLEHQSTPDAIMPVRFFRAIAELWAQLLANDSKRTTLPAIIPVLVHNGETPWQSPRALSDLYELRPDLLRLVRPILPELHYVIDDLRLQTEEDLDRRAAETYLHLALLSLRARGVNPPEARLPVWTELFRELRRAKNEAALDAILIYNAEVAGEEGSRVIDAAIAADPGIKENYVTLYERILREGEARGIAKGIEEGIEKGIEKGEATLLEKMLRLKFGELPADIRTRLADAKTPELERWAERILSAQSLSDVFDEPNSK